ncbi:Taurine-transporting ATPase [Bertholletia excelsa]
MQPQVSQCDKKFLTSTYNEHETTKLREMEAVPKENAEKNGKIFLAWKDLWVTVAGGKGGSRSILQGATGYARRGEVLAIMGPSGSGKSTLLDALAGRLAANTRQTGDILINGRKQTLAYGRSAYVTQDETLIATLTVREAIYYSAQLQLPDSMSRAEKKERAEMTIKEMGLEGCSNTAIGGWGVKGLSGGQKRRVSICIEILTRPTLLFLDEPTSGLDSAASYYVMTRIAQPSQHRGRTIVVSIHQPSSEVFQLFQSLCLLSSGRTVYFGPAGSAIEFFALNGFPCPTLENPCDHFIATINMDFDEDIEQGITGKKAKEEAINVLVNSYKSSNYCQEVQRQVGELCNSQEGEPGISKRSHAGFLAQCDVLTRRTFKNMCRDLGYYWLRLVIYIGLALGLGTIFYNLGSSYSSIQARGSMLMFVSTFLTFMAISGFPSFVEEMKVFRQERLNGHYGCGAFIIANTISSAPFLLLISFIPGAIAYYVAGLHRGLEHFFYFSLVLFVSMMLVESLMMIIVSFISNFLMGIIIGSGIQGIMILGGGFFRLPGDLPNTFWKYPLYYIAFHKYAYQGLFKNEFEGLTFPSSEMGGSPMVDGEYVLRNLWQVEMGYSKWVDLATLMGMLVLYRFFFFAIVRGGEKVRPWGFLVGK